MLRVVSAAAAVMTLTAGLVVSGAEIREGEPFPLLEFPRASDGKLVSLADYRGEKLIVHVFASW